MTPARGITRRTLLAAAGAGAAARLTRPAGALAALAGAPRPALWQAPVGALAGQVRRIELARSADLVGVQWQGPAGAGLQLSFRSPSGRWSRWVSALGCAGAHGPDRVPGGGQVVGQPLWTGGASAVALRSSRPLAGVRLHLVDVSGGVGEHRRVLGAGALAAPASLALAQPLLPAGAGQPPIIARRAWAQGACHPRVAPAYGAVQLAFVHHTENPNGYLPGEVPAMLRAIFAFHRFVNGWNDIGYNFVVDLYGRVFEARAGGIDEPVVGAHAGGYNLLSSGVAVLGSFMARPISPAARRTLSHLLAWKLSLHGVPAEGRVTVRVNPAGAGYSRFPADAPVSLPRIAGHRDGDSTDCPGDVLYGELPGIRPGVLALSARAALATLALGPPPPAFAPPPAPPPGAGPPGEAPPAPPAPPAAPSAQLSGGLTLLDGTPLAGAAVALQARSVSRRGEAVAERPLAQAVTDAQGQWSLPLWRAPGAGAGVWLRALYAGAPAAGGSPPAGAAVSPPLWVAPVPQFSAPAP